MAIIDKKQTRWYSKSTFDSLDKTTIPVGTEIQVAGEIEETDLTADLQTKINGKLTAPTTPINDSVVTMAANGTVGTKALSEFGGKLYLHRISFQISPNKVGEFYFYSENSTAYSSISSLPTMQVIGYIDYPESKGAVQYTYVNPEPILSASGVVFDSETNECKFINSINIQPTSINDTVIDL